MWPKAIAQLIELAPHVSRLVPLADRFFQSKSASEESTKRAMDAVAEGLRGDLGQVTAAHAGLYRQLSEHTEQLAGIAQEVGSLKASHHTSNERLAALERKFAAVMKLLALLLVLNVAVLLLLVVIVTRHR